MNKQIDKKNEIRNKKEKKNYSFACKYELSSNLYNFLNYSKLI